MNFFSNTGNKKGKKLKILFVTTEQKPFCQVGGLGTVMHSLPKALSELGHDSRVIMPKYLTVEDEKGNILPHAQDIMVPTENETGEAFLVCNVKKYKGGTEKEKPNTTYFLENMEYYEKRANPYGYADDTIRWALLCKGTLEFLLVSDWIPDIIVCTDWPAGYLPNYLKTEYRKYTKLSKIITVFSIHNISHQGMFKHQFVSEMDYDAGQAPMPPLESERMKFMNGMRRGIMYADVINTVSETYAREIVEDVERGEGLSELLAERRGILHGILNGIDYDSWNPENDNFVPSHFNSKNLEARSENKILVQKHFGLEESSDSFLVGIVSRLSDQKGFSLLDGSIEKLLEEIDLQLVIVGEGDSKYMNYFKKLQEQFPRRVGFQFNFDDKIPRLIFSGSDSILIPSKFEPSGLTQMEAMRYGSVPIVRKVGGLADTVFDYSSMNSIATGFVFEKFDPFSFSIAVVRAYENFKNPTVWKMIQKNGMSQDFSWKSSAKVYEKVFFDTLSKIQ
jgi:starch synthase